MRSRVPAPKPATRRQATGWRTLRFASWRAVALLDHLLEAVHGVEQAFVQLDLAGRRELRVMDAHRGVAGVVPDQALVHLLGGERDHRGEKLHGGDQALVKGLVGGELVGVVLALPEPAPAAAQVPAGEGVHEGLQLPHEEVDRVGLVALPGGPDELLETLEDPAVELRQAVHGHPRRALRHEAVDFGVGEEELVDVPEGQELPARLVDLVPAEAQVVLGVVGGEEPAHGVGALALGRLVELDGVALGLVHLLAVLVLHRPVAEEEAEGRAVLHHRAHRQDGVEPVPELARVALGDPVGREPALPVLGVDPVVERRVRDDPGVEPGVSHVGNPPEVVSAARAGNLDGVHPRPVWGVALEILPAGHDTLSQLFSAPHHLEGPAVGTGVDGQRQAPVALLRDHPVLHVVQPLQLELRPVSGIQRVCSVTCLISPRNVSIEMYHSSTSRKRSWVLQRQQMG